MEPLKTFIKGSKNLTIYFTFLFSSSLYSFSLDNCTFYQWEYLVSPEISRGTSYLQSDPNLNRYFRTYKRLLINNGISESNFEYGFNAFFNPNLGSIPNQTNPISIIVFSIAEPISIGFRVYIYNKEDKKIKGYNYFLYKDDKNLENAPKDISTWVLENLNKAVPINQRTIDIFNEALLIKKAEYLNLDFSYTNAKNNDFKSSDDCGIKKPKIDDLVEESIKYFEEPELRRSCFDITFRNFQTKRNKRIYKNILSKLWVLKRFDNSFKLKVERLDENENLTFQEKNHIKNKLRSSLDSIWTSDGREYSKKEEKYLEKHGHKFKRLEKQFKISLTNVLYSDTILNNARGLLKSNAINKARNSYFQLLSEKSLKINLKVLAPNAKSNAYLGFMNCQEAKFSNYLELIEKGLSLDSTTSNCNIDAMLAFNSANSSIGGLSVYIEHIKDVCFKKMLKDSSNLFATIKSEIVSEFQREFGRYHPLDELNTKIIRLKNKTILNGRVISLIFEDSLGLNGRFIEVNFDYGKYESNYEEDLLLRLNRVLSFAIEEFGDYIDKISFSYTGSSDGTKWKDGKKALKVSKDPFGVNSYEKLNIPVCEEFMTDPERVKAQCFPLQDLINCKASALFKEIDENGNEIEITKLLDPHYSKNLALAYLRAKYRHDKLISILSIPNEKYYVGPPTIKNLKEKNCDCNCDCEIHPLVKNKSGFQYRYVDMNIDIEFKLSREF